MASGGVEPLDGGTAILDGDEQRISLAFKTVCGRFPEVKEPEK